MTPQIQHLATAQAKLHIEEWGGEGQPVVLVHGGPGLYGYQKEVANRLARHGYRVWDYYQRGGPESLSASTGPFTLSTFQEDLRAVIEMVIDETGEAPTLVGHSWGGLLTLTTLSLYPHLARKAVVVGCMPFCSRGMSTFLANIDARLDEAERLRRSENFAKLFGATDEADRETMFIKMSDAIFKTYQRNATRQFSAELTGWSASSFFAVHGDVANVFQQGRILDELRAVQCPVAMIHGDYDPSPGFDIRDQLAASLNDFKATMIENCGHYPWWESEHTLSRFYSILLDELRD
jgi:proline iminopeptidase